jgi:hypothetical protein
MEIPPRRVNARFESQSAAQGNPLRFCECSKFTARTSTGNGIVPVAPIMLNEVATFNRAVVIYWAADEVGF